MQNPDAVAGKSQPGTWRLGHNQVVGAVFISHEKNPELDDQTNREGLLQGRAFIHLRAFAEKRSNGFNIITRRLRKDVKLNVLQSKKQRTRPKSL